MISKILKTTKGKPCSCPLGKICTGCSSKGKLKPQIIIEEPKGLTLPILITHEPKKPPTTVEIIKRSGRSKTRTKRKNDEKRMCKLCQWYKRRRALRELIVENDKRKKQEQYERELREREQVLKKHVQRRKTKTIQSSPPAKVKTEKIYVTERAAIVKPRAESRYVAVKTYNQRDSISNRFVNFCYRICCEFYCCLSFVFIIGICIVLII